MPEVCGVGRLNARGRAGGGVRVAVGGDAVRCDHNDRARLVDRQRTRHIVDRVVGIERAADCDGIAAGSAGGGNGGRHGGRVGRRRKRRGRVAISQAVVANRQGRHGAVVGHRLVVGGDRQRCGSNRLVDDVRCAGQVAGISAVDGRDGIRAAAGRQYRCVECRRVVAIIHVERTGADLIGRCDRSGVEQHRPRCGCGGQAGHGGRKNCRLAVNRGGRRRGERRRRRGNGHIDGEAGGRGSTEVLGDGLVNRVGPARRIGMRQGEAP